MSYETIGKGNTIMYYPLMFPWPAYWTNCPIINPRQLEKCHHYTVDELAAKEFLDSTA